MTSIIDTFDIASFEATNVILTPYRDVLAEGTYDSEIVSLEEVLTNGKATALDCIQSLTDSEGTEYLVRFRVYLEDLQKWASTFAGYGIKGSLRSLIGVRESVTIKHGRKYAYIGKRQIVAPIAEAEAQNTEKILQETSPPRKKQRSVIGGRRNSQHTNRERLITDEVESDDDEFDDFADFDDLD